MSQQKPGSNIKQSEYFPAVTLTQRFFGRVFNRVPVPPSINALLPAAVAQADGMPAEPCIVVMQGDSDVFVGLLYSLARRGGFSAIRHAADLINNHPLRTDPVLYWISLHELSTLEQLAKRVQRARWTTLSVFRARGPLKENPTYRAGAIRQLGYVLGRRFLFVVFGTPVQLEHAALRGVRALKRSLQLDFYKNLKLVRGGSFHTIETQSRIILSGPEFDRELTILSSRLKISKEEVLRRTRKAFLEMAANPRRIFYDIAAWGVTLISNRLFGDIRVAGLEEFRETVKKTTVVLVPMHRSHLDYMILGHLLYQQNLNPPLVAAGVNLNFWPVGFILRSLGAYFVKRDAKRDRVHALLIRRYVTYLMKRGHLQEFFIEGGRSRSGRMRQPKLGLLSIMTDAYVKRLKRDVAFIPVSIVYENVVEDRTFAQENTGKKKHKENFVTLVKAHGIFKRSYGDVSVRFGKAIYASQLFESAARPGARPPNVILGGELVNRIRSQTESTVTGLACTALLMSPKYGLQKEQLIAQIKQLARLAERYAEFAGYTQLVTPAVNAFCQGRTHTIDILVRAGICQSLTAFDQVVLAVPGTARYTAEFYKNGVLHQFFALATLSLIDLCWGSLNLERAEILHEIFANDFLLPEYPQFKQELQFWIQMLDKSAELEQTSSGEFKFRSRRTPSFIPALLAAPLQSLLWVYLNLKSAKSRLPDITVPLEQRSIKVIPYVEFLRTLQDDFRSAGYLGVFTRTEAASQSNLEGVLDALSQREFISIVEQNGKRVEINLYELPDAEIELLELLNRSLAGWFLDGERQQDSAVTDGRAVDSQLN